MPNGRFRLDGSLGGVHHGLSVTGNLTQARAEQKRRRAVKGKPRVLVVLLLASLLAAGAISGCSEAASTGSLMSSRDASQSTEAATGATVTPDLTTPDAPPDQTPPSASDLVLVPAIVTRVVDGDTAVMTLRGTTSERVRFIGVDTPESTTEHEPYGEEASAFTKTRLTGKKVWLQVGVEERDRYGRLLAYVWLAQPKDTSEAELRSKQFNAQLLVEGYAQMMTIPPNVDYVDAYRAFQAEARDADRGLWGLPVTSDSQGTSGESDSSGGNTSATYIGNRNTKKLHYATCSSVGQMNPANKVPFATRAAAIAAGYVPCKICRP
jgi:micrococcal nuclease